MIIRKEINITRLLNLFNVLVDLRNKYTHYFSLLCNSAPPSLSVAIATVSSFFLWTHKKSRQLFTSNETEIEG